MQTKNGVHVWMVLASLWAAICLATARNGDHWFCHELDCPDYQVVRSAGDDLELRKYTEASLWVSTNVSEVRYDAATRYGFLRLFEYISGANEHGWRIDMTAPVRVKLIAGAGPFCEDTFTVSFFLPMEYQDGRKKPPAPNRDSLFIESTPASQYWVYSYSGFASESKVLQSATDVLGRLDRMGERYSAATYYSASYDPPFRLINRHNEIWIPAAEDKPNSATGRPATAATVNGTAARTGGGSSDGGNGKKVVKRVVTAERLAAANGP